MSKPRMQPNEKAEGLRDPRASTPLGESQAVVETTEVKRPPRVPMSAGGKLNVPNHLIDPNYHYYLAVDREGDLEKMQAAYWEFVLDEKGQKWTVSAGHGNTHYLMRLPNQYWEEDKAARRAENEARLAGFASVGPDEYAEGMRGQTGVGSALRKIQG